MRPSILLTLFLAASSAYSAQFIPHFPKSTAPAIPAEDYWDRVEVLVETLNLTEKVSQLIFVKAFGEPWSDTQNSYLRLRRQVESTQVGGIVFFGGNSADQVKLTNHLQKLAALPLLVAQDMEYGAAMRVEDATRFIPAMGITATGKSENARIMGHITAVEAKALGVHQVYAPVVDVNNNPANPIINVRSFSDDPETVSEYAVEFIKGVQSTGLMATAKHFPGHGDTENDSHFTLPVIRHDYARLDTVELPPFRRSIGADVASIMSAHISFPKLSAQPRIPGTLDPEVLGRLLLDSLHFRGLVVSDALEMRGVTSVIKPGEAAVAAIKAGVDLLVLPPNPDEAISALVGAVEDGSISEHRINASLRKLLHWKFQLGLFDHRWSNPDYTLSMLGNETHKTSSERIARESITVVKNEAAVLPLSPHLHRRVLLLGVSNDRSGDKGRALARKMADYHPEVQFLSLNPRTTGRQEQEIIRAARAADVVVVTTYYTVVTGEITTTPGPRERLLRQIQNLSTPSVMVSLGSPYTMSSMKNAEAHMVAWSGDDQHVEGVAAALFGASAISGMLPVTLPDLHPKGSGLKIPQQRLRVDHPLSVQMHPDTLASIDHIMNRAISDSVFPGGVVAVVKNGVMVHHKAYGRHTYETDARPYTTDDLFDLASLTKVMATTTAVMRLVDQGKISTDDLVSQYLPEYDTDEKRGITIRQLLTHESGLPAFRVYVDQLKTRGEILRAALTEPLIQSPGTQYVYSDLGFISLAQIVENVTGLPFDAYTQQELFGPLGMKSTGFNPLNRDLQLLERIPPTEIDTVYRMKTVKGEVHDERAWYMDGLAGHAGLFSTSTDVAIWATMLQQGGHYNRYRIAGAETVGLFTAQQSTLAKRGFGFDMRSDTGFSSAGSRMGTHTFGHTGFTGTSVWMDPELDLTVIVLTNRTWPYRRGSGPIGAVRASVADTAVQSIME